MDSNGTATSNNHVIRILLRDVLRWCDRAFTRKCTEHELSTSVVAKLQSYSFWLHFWVFSKQIDAHNSVLIWLIFDQKKEMALSGQAESKLTLKCDWHYPQALREVREFWTTRREHIQVNSWEIRSLTYPQILNTGNYQWHLHYIKIRKKFQKQFSHNFGLSAVSRCTNAHGRTENDGLYLKKIKPKYIFERLGSFRDGVVWLPLKNHQDQVRTWNGFRIWHFRASKFQEFLGKHTPRPP